MPCQTIPRKGGRKRRILSQTPLATAACLATDAINQQLSKSADQQAIDAAIAEFVRLSRGAKNVWFAFENEMNYSFTLLCAGIELK